MSLASLPSYRSNNLINSVSNSYLSIYENLYLLYIPYFQTLERMKIAVIGQSLFGADVYKLLQKNGHQIVGVFTVPDVNGKPDPLGR